MSSKKDKKLADSASVTSIIERIHRVRDMILEHSTLKRFVSFPYIRNKLGSTEHEAEHALTRAAQLYLDLKEVKFFNNYRYYYHSSIFEEDLKAAVTMKMNCIRMTETETIKYETYAVGITWRINQRMIKSEMMAE